LAPGPGSRHLEIRADLEPDREKSRTEIPGGPLSAALAPGGVVTVHRDIMDEFVKG